MMHMVGPRSGLGGDPSIDRRKQINTLLIFNENVSEIQPNLHYRVDFTSGGRQLSLVIFLPPEFPKVRPTVLVEPRNVRHPWIREDGAVIGAPGLISFGIHSDLGRVVQAIKRELEKNPPLFPPQHPQASSNQGHSLVNGATPFAHQQQPSQPQGGVYPGAIRHPSQASNPTTQSPVSQESQIPELSKLKPEELQELSQNPVALKSFVRSLQNQKQTESINQNISAVRNQIDELLSERRRLADDIETKRGQLLQEVDRYHSLRERLQQTASGIKEYRSRYSVRNLCDLMQASSLADEEQSEKCAENFLAGHLDVDQFLAGYVELRRSHHKKKVTVDRKLRR